MKPVDRLLKARQHVRDQAAEKVSAARRRLQMILERQSQNTEDCRERVEQALNGETLTPAQLELMADRCQAAGLATCACEENLEEARQEAMESYRNVRQVEIIRDKAREEQKKEQRRKERKTLDDIANRPKDKALLSTVMVMLVGLLSLG